MGYTIKQIDPPEIYGSICMHRRRATKTLTTTLYAQMQSHQKFDCDFAQCKATKTFTMTGTNNWCINAKIKLPKQL